MGGGRGEEGGEGRGGEGKERSRVALHTYVCIYYVQCSQHTRSFVVKDYIYSPAHLEDY